MRGHGEGQQQQLAAELRRLQAAEIASESQLTAARVTAAQTSAALVSVKQAMSLIGQQALESKDVPALRCVVMLVLLGVIIISLGANLSNSKQLSTTLLGITRRSGTLLILF